MVKAGMNVARLNFSHGTYEWHRGAIKNIRAIAKKLDQPIAIVGDLQGPRIRVGELDKDVDFKKRSVNAEEKGGRTHIYKISREGLAAI